MNTKFLSKMLLVIAIFFSFTIGGSLFAQQDAKSRETFEFSSGGAYHIEGFGEWIIRLE